VVAEVTLSGTSRRVPTAAASGKKFTERNLFRFHVDRGGQDRRHHVLLGRPVASMPSSATTNSMSQRPGETKPMSDRSSDDPGERLVQGAITSRNCVFESTMTIPQASRRSPTWWSASDLQSARALSTRSRSKEPRRAQRHHRGVMSIIAPLGDGHRRVSAN